MRNGAALWAVGRLPMSWWSSSDRGLTMGGQPKLIFFCGKMAAGKSTLSKTLAGQEQAVLLVQDDWLSHLFPGEILGVPDYIRCSAGSTRP